MKISCEIVKDLLPMYQDKALSEESRLIVKEHLKTCSDCRTYRKSISAEIQKQDAPKESAASKEENYLPIAKRLKKRYRIEFALLAAAGLVAVGMAIVTIVMSNKDKKD